MKNIIEKLLLLCSALFLPLILLGQTVTLTRSGGITEYAIPGVETTYFITVSSGVVSRMDVTLTNGSFSPTSTNRYWTAYTNAPIIVYWENVSGVSGTPKGTIKVDLTVNGVAKSVSLDQLIRSLKGVKPPSIYSTPATAAMGVTDVQISFVSPFYYPGTPTNGTSKREVESYEWTLPTGWKDRSSGNTGTFVTGNSSIWVTTSDMEAGIVKVRGVNKESRIDDKSEYASVSISRSTSASLIISKSPSSPIKWGVSSVYSFEAQLLSGNCTYEWSAPAGWKINGGTNSYSAVNANKVSITTSVCPTDGVVRVRLKKGTVTSDWVTASYGGVVDPGINTGTFYQFEYGTPSIDLPSANISNVNWTATNGVVVSGQGTNAPKILFSQSGSVVLTATFTLNGCGTKTLSKTITVQPCRYSISGNAVVCSVTRETYGVSNVTVPSEVQLTWNVGDRLDLLSGQGTSSIVTCAAVSKWGDQSISLTIKYGTQSQIKTKTVYVSYPIVTTVTGPTTLRRDETGSFTANPYYSSDVSDYKWTISPSTGVTQSPYRHTNMISFSQEGSYTVSCQAYTARCGASGSAGMTYVSVYGSYNVYSSPGSKVVTIVESELSNNANGDAAKNMAAANAKVVRTTVPYKLIESISGRIVAEGQFPAEGGILDFSSQADGVYVLTFHLADGTVEAHKLVLN